MKRHAMAQRLEQRVARARRLERAQGVHRLTRGGQVHAHREQFRAAPRLVLGLHENETVFAAFREVAHILGQHFPGRIAHRLRQRLAALAGRVVGAVAEPALVQHAVAQFDRAPLVIDQFRAHPLRQLLRPADDRRKAQQPAAPPVPRRHLRFRAVEQPRQQQFGHGAAFRVRQNLQFIRDDQVDLRRPFRAPHQQLRQLLVNRDGDIEVAPVESAVELAAVARAHDHIQPIRAVFLLKVVVLLLRQRLQRHQVHHLLAAQRRAHPRHLADKRLARTRRRLYQQVVLAEQPEVTHRLFLKRQQPLALLRAPHRHNRRRYAIPDQFHDLHDDNPPLFRDIQGHGQRHVSVNGQHVFL